jgi:hypothetical protein
MGWLRIDDGFMDHPKVVGLTDAAVVAHMRALTHCTRFETDGVVTEAYLSRIASPEIAAELLAAGVWEDAGGGIEIHDFLDYNPSHEQAEAARAVNAERQRRWRENHRDVPLGRFTRNGVTDGVSNAARNTAPTRPDPTPYRPDDDDVPESAESDALGRDGADAGVRAELGGLLDRFDDLSTAQRAEVEQAWTKNPDGVARLLEAVLANDDAHRPAGLLLSQLRDGLHLRDRATARRPEPCPECEVGGGHHVAGCSRASGGADLGGEP